MPSASAFLRHGTLLLRNVVAADKVSAAREAFFARCASYLDGTPHPESLVVGDRRYMITLDLQPPFTDPAVFAPAPVLTLLRELLSPDCVLASFGAVLALPGAQAQHVHRDYSGGLFPGTPLEAMLPPYAVTVVVPLIDVNEVTGSTVVWPGSHRQREVATDFGPSGARWGRMSVGDVLLMDYRLVHAGAANRSNVPRPILYFVYARPWFRDNANFQIQSPLQVTAEGRASVPTEFQRLIPQRP